MKRLLVVVAGAALVVAASMSVAWGKGPVKATLRGPGLDRPVTFGGGEMTGSDVMVLAEHSGLFPALFTESPSPMEEDRPATDLGPRYTVSYTIPAPAGGAGTVIQHIYPYASGGPVTHTPPDQPFLEGEGPGGEAFLTHGGWYEASSVLKSTLVSAGLPSAPPRAASTPASGSRGTESAPVLVAAGAVVVLCAGAVLLAFRRRSPLSTHEGAV